MFATTSRYSTTTWRKSASCTIRRHSCELSCLALRLTGPNGKSSQACNCTHACQSFLRRAGLRQEDGTATALSQAEIVIAPCYGLRSGGGAQWRCVETARHMTRLGVPGHCFESSDLGVGACNDKALEPIAARARITPFRAVIFLKRLPGLPALRNSPVLIDIGDAPHSAYSYLCADRVLREQLDGGIAEYDVSWCFQILPGLHRLFSKAGRTATPSRRRASPCLFQCHGPRH